MADQPDFQYDVFISYSHNNEAWVINTLLHRLAEMALTEGDREKALVHALQARQLAFCDGPPDYTYKVAYEEAGALLERLKDEG